MIMASSERTYKWPSEWHQLGKDFSSLFLMPFGGFYDPLMSWLMGRFVIDIQKLDDSLHSLFGDYEDLGMSMQEIIKLKYGSRAAEFIEALI